jgi:holo-[acyl-carrier protein] synthase
MSRSSDVRTITETLTARVGTDVTDVTHVMTSIVTFGARYLERIYTPSELDVFEENSAPAAARLAARFAAKEATIKVLRPTAALPDWRSIEVRRHAGGWCSLELCDDAYRLAHRAGITDVAVSLTHESTVAAAVVIALCEQEAGQRATDDRKSTQRYAAPLRTGGAEMEDAIRRILAEHGRLPVPLDSLRDDSDLYRAGLTSHASVNVMLALEDTFDIEFPQQMLRKKTFESVEAIRDALAQLITASAI